MSGKFMKIRKIVIPTITMLIIASQLLGCAAASSKEMLAMLERQEAITIEVAEPISQEQGTQQTYEWVELASLDTYSDFRTTVDDILNITAHGNNGKNGILYIDLEGNHTNNSTMYFAFSNQKFIENAWNNSKILPQLLEATKAIYADVETDAVAKVAFLNAYFNILPDAEPNYFNGNQTLTRAEYLAAVYRAGTPVSTLETDVVFTSLVDPLGTNENTAFANQMMDYSYLTIADESLNNKTFDGTISRAEAIYTIVRMYYNAEYESLTGKESSFSDIKNGGDILEKAGKKYLKENETTADAVKFGKSYELNYMLQNPDKGVTPELYKAMVVAKNHGLITGTECRWNEAITKAEAINILSRVYIDLGTVTNADRGNAVGEVIGNTTNNESTGSTNNLVSGDVNDITESSGKLHIYIDIDGYLTYSKELGAAAREALKAEGISVDDYLSKLINRYYKATLNEDNTVIHHDILDGLASDLATELAEAANTGSNTESNDASNKDENSNSSDNGNSTSNNNGGSGNSGNNGGAGSAGNDYETTNPKEEVAGSADSQFGNMEGNFGGGGQGEIPDGFTGIH